VLQQWVAPDHTKQFPECASGIEGVEKIIAQRELSFADSLPESAVPNDDPADMQVLFLICG
jgi:hypothetical protein